MKALHSQVVITLRWALRERLLYAVFGVALFMFLLVPAFSTFSMRQVQELSITLTLAVNSVVMVLVAILLGTSSLWREIERRYTASVLTLPLSRGNHLLGKFCGIALFLLLATVILALLSAGTVYWSSAFYPSDTPLKWMNLGVAVSMLWFKAVIIAAMALLFTTFATSFYLPFFATLTVYFCGSASQGVYDYVSGSFGEELPHVITMLLKMVYYLIPNFSAFDYTLQAIYGLPITVSEVAFTGFYCLVYSVIVLSISLWAFCRRQLS